MPEVSLGSILIELKAIGLSGCAGESEALLSLGKLTGGRSSAVSFAQTLFRQLPNQNFLTTYPNMKLIVLLRKFL